MKYYQRLKDLRNDKDLKQIEIAKILKTTQKQYSRWETGEFQIPFDKAIELSEFYQVSLDYIAGRTNNKLGYKPKKIKDETNSQFNITQNNQNGDNIFKIKK